ncbi:Altered inheritance of mitochondria protein 21 [Elaphomyces granulatus]
MSTQAAPVIPPRPSRSPNPLVVPISVSDGPKIPSRTAHRRIERSISPVRANYAPSPLNEPPPNGSSMVRSVSNDLPQRPPSVTIPSLGEEGIEYDDLPIETPSLEKQQGTPAETRNVSSDLKLHAPKPSLPTASAKARVQAVTHTDSQQAAAAGFGKAPSPSHDDIEHHSRSLHSKTNGSRAESSTASTDRRQSLQFGDELGIPEIGQRVPMYPNAGDVQAPSPSPFPSAVGPATPGAPLRPSRHHYRTRSGREVCLPPGSYGLHGHGVPANDKFEKAWYDKHPDEFVREEHGQYGPGISPRPDWALSRDDLNKIVRSSASNGAGLGTSPAVKATPEEELGYIASEEYTSRLTSPPPGTVVRNDAQPVFESPLRNASFPAPEVESKGSTQSAASSEAGEGSVIHVDEPYRQLHHPDGYAHTPDHWSHSPMEGDTEHDEPILAADEVQPESLFMQPAISPAFERSGSIDYDMERTRSQTPSAPSSRPASRTRGLHGAPPNLARFNSRGEEYEENYTSLEDVEEYEPLFPEDAKGQKPISTVERIKGRPDGLKHRFPSQDIWEDTPDSLQLHTSVTTPDHKGESVGASGIPAVESSQKKRAEQPDSDEAVSQTRESGQPFPETSSRPETIKQRFPSQDIWEDAPDSHQLVTTVEPSEEEAKSPQIPSKPSIPPRPPKIKLGDTVQEQSRPQRPAKPDLSSKDTSSEENVAPPTDTRKVPAVVSERPKPQIPARPSRPISRNLPENVTKETIANSGDSSRDASIPPATKPKPPVPGRPLAGKIANLKAGFLSDLNSRLQQGPQAPKPVEKEELEDPADKGPLSDARKGRARGPVRRKPAPTTETKLPSIPEIRIMDAWNVWQVGQDGNMIVGEKENDTSESTDVPIAPLISSIAGEPTDPSTSIETKQAAHVHSNADESIAGSTGSPPSIVPGVTPTSEAQDLDQARTGPLIGQSTQENEPGIASAEVQGPSSPPETISGTNLE